MKMPGFIIKMFPLPQGEDGEAGDPGPVGEPGTSVSYNTFIAYICCPIACLHLLA